jgi:protein-disulfide isomerase
MRIVSLLLSTAFIAFAPAMAQAADTAPTVTPVVHSIQGAPLSKSLSTPEATPVTATGSQAPAVAAAPASTPSALTDAQRAAVEDVIKDYLTKKNPEVLMEAMQELQKRQVADSQAKSKAALSTSHDKLYGDASSPIGGNPKGDVTVVEFFDYQCGYCKMSEPNIQKLLKEDKNVKFIYKDFPVLGPSSTMAAKAALASVKQGKYLQFHDALFSTAKFSHSANPAADEEAVFKAAREVGLDVDKLKKDMDDAEITKIVEGNVALGTEIGARGTPTFIIGEQLYPGALEYPQLKKAIDDARASGGKPAATPAATSPAAPKKP